MTLSVGHGRGGGDDLLVFNDTVEGPRALSVCTHSGNCAERLYVSECVPTGGASWRRNKKKIKIRRK